MRDTFCRHAGATPPSFELAARTLQLLADVPISSRHVGRLTELVGAEMVARRDEQAEAHRTRRLEASVPNTPTVVAVEVDRGRYQRRAEGLGCGARSPQWREDKVACLVTLASDTHEADPQPEPPECFLDREHVRSMTQCPRGEDSEPTGENTLSTPQAEPDVVDCQPERLVRTCVATTRGNEEFGRLVGAEAKARNFEVATRRAFVGDGQAYHWAIQKRWFADYTAVVDFIHVLGYVWLAAVRVEVLGYFRNQVHRMDYPTDEANDWSIGSGAHESACKTVVGSQMRGAGMRWVNPGRMLCAMSARWTAANRASGPLSGSAPWPRDTNVNQQK